MRVLTLWLIIVLVCLIAVACSSSVQEEATVNEAETQRPPRPPAPMAPPPPPPPPMPDYQEGYEPYVGSPGYSYVPPVDEAIGVTAEGASSPPPVFQDVMSQLMEASFVHTWPSRVNVYERFNVTLALNPSLTEDALREQIEADGAQVASGRVKISQLVIAELSAPDFDVERISDGEQVVDMRETTEWRWRLTPRNAGEDKEISIVISALVDVDGEKRPRFIKAYEGNIYVDVTAYQSAVRFFEANWQWAWSALLIPALIWWRRRRKGETGDE